jgi:electron-transferring-flavoprotein dehydrogenase
MDAPIKVPVKEDNFYMLGPAGQIRIPNWPMPPLMSNHGNYIVSMANVCRWMAGVPRAGRRDLPRHGLLGTGLGRRARCRASSRASSAANPDGTPGPNYEPGMELRGKYVFLSEGVRGSLAKQVIAKYDLSKGH